MELDSIDRNEGKIEMYFTIKSSEIQSLEMEIKLAQLEFFYTPGLGIYELEIPGIKLVFYNMETLAELAEISKREESRKLE